MNKIYKVISLTLLIPCFSISQNIIFEKNNFSDRKELYKEAKKNLDDGQDAFETGKKEYEFLLNSYINKHRFIPVSRSDYQRAGDIYYKEAKVLLLKANSFNPNNANLNYMLGVIYFNLNPYAETSIFFFEKAFSLKGNIPDDALYYCAWANQFQYKWDEAINYYQKYLLYLNVNTQENQYFIEDVNKKIEECKIGKQEMASPKKIIIDNIGNAINTKYPEYGVFINADESMMVFTARQENSTGGKNDGEIGAYFEDIYTSNFSGTQWGQAKNMGIVVNSDNHDATAGLSSDGSKMYIYKYKDNDGGDIYVSNLKGTSWSKPEHLNKNINSKSHESTVSLSFDGKKLYYVSDKEGGNGDKDIYVSKQDIKNDWGVSENIGIDINTKYAEEGVFVHPDGKTIYFSSKGHKTMGGYDVFKSIFENGKWSEPENLGYPINGPDDDVFFVISGSGRHGYFASSKQGGFGSNDIYRISFESTKDSLIVSGPKLTVLKGVISDAKTKMPIEATIELIDNTINKLIASFISNSSTGKYLVSLPSGKNYGIVVKHEGYLFHSENFDIPASKDYQEIEKNIELKKIEIGESIILKNIFFDFNKTTIRNESINELERLVLMLVKTPTLKVELGSHTDNKGTDEYNKKLSQARSESVVNYLISKGIVVDRLVAKGYSESAPIATNETEEGRQENRRTEFKILGK